jgi:hypothetical protein
MHSGFVAHTASPTRTLSLVVIVLLAGHAALAWMAVQATFVFIELTWRTVAARHDYRALLVAHLEQFQILRGVQLTFWVVTIAAFVLWVGRAHGNLSRLGATGRRYTRRESVTAFLVPGVNLVRPVTVLRELWTASEALARPIEPPRTCRVPLRVRWWWTLLVSALALEAIAGGLALRSGRPLDLGPAMQVLVAGQLLTGAAALVAIAVVLEIGNLQDAAWRRTSVRPEA